ncbi:MAG: VCBS repeat-containing protein [Ferruginibacter sp.]
MQQVRIIFYGLIIMLCSCTNKHHPLFGKMESAATGINFTNTLTEDQQHNLFAYEYFYNGTGVATGDINNDGLTDIYLTGNQVPAKLYLNKGDWKFEDITQAAGVAGKDAWKTGVSMADLNGDGFLDIYVCYSGFGTEADRANQLFINNGTTKSGEVSFTEQAAAYGLDAPGTYTSQAVFFDYDRDGDLDMFMLNHANMFYSPFFNTRRLRNLRHPQFGNRLYRNDHNHFTDVSAIAGIYGNGINFGLGIAVSDLDNDGWPDLYVSNDFEEQDYLYLNNRNGTFREVCKDVFAHISRSTMGVDIADYNNDLLPDVVSLDMLAEDNHRQKILKGPDQYDKFRLMVDSGYGFQYSRNMLQLNRGIGKDGLPVFSEIGQLAGVSNTDWSWSSLFADFDNDGWKDLFVTNGFLRDYTNLDFLKFDVANTVKETIAEGKDISSIEKYRQNMPLNDLVKRMPSTKISNYLFRNRKDLTFANETINWGLDEPGVSNGAAYADLDNDGDLDLIVCNNNQPVWVYNNHSNEQFKNNYLEFKLAGAGMNRFAIGAKVFVTVNDTTQLLEQYPVRGYQSSVDYKLCFGTGKNTEVSRVKVVWPNGKISLLEHIKTNQVLTISENTSTEAINFPVLQKAPLFTDVTASAGIDFVQHENEFVDFKKEFLIPYQLSRQGPKMTKADVNKDGNEDVFIGGPAGQMGVLYLQNDEGKFIHSPSQPWLADSACEDVNSLFFDADGDGDADLYIVSGGNEYPLGSALLQDRLYINDGKGKFSKALHALPAAPVSGSCVTACDYDHDGDPDLFIGTRVAPGNYPLSTASLLLRNDSKKGAVIFTNVTRDLAPGFKDAGMVTDAIWIDADKDGWEDLVVAGEWEGIKIYHNERGRFSITSKEYGLENTGGFWCKIIPADIDNDGDIDFVTGNLGDNTPLKATIIQPLTLFVNDFDNDGRNDPVITWYVQNKSYPFNSRDELAEQMPVLNKKFLHYSDFADATIDNMFSPGQIQQSKKFYIYTTQTSLLVNKGNNHFELKALPVEAQFTMSQGIIYDDFDGDGKKDLLLTGNFFPFRVQQGRSDAGTGCLLRGDGRGNFEPVKREKTGLLVQGDVRDMISVKGKKGDYIIISKNNDAIQVIQKTRGM